MGALLAGLVADAGAAIAAVSSRCGLYLPPWDIPALVRQAEAIERLGSPLGPLGAAFVAARADR